MKFRQLTTIYLASGALWVAWVLIIARPAAGSGWALGIFACFGLSLALAAYLTWRADASAWPLALVLQLLQLPYLRTATINWSLYAPVNLVIGWQGSLLTVAVHLDAGAGLSVGARPDIDGWVVGLNLAPLIALWLLDRAQAGRQARGTFPRAA